MSIKSISSPIPLPIGLKLLPSLLPGKQLTPCLYTVINDLPIFLIISPTSEPQLSFLCLILALEHDKLASPLSLGIWHNPTPNTFNSTLNGLAPWSDIWIPLTLARVIIRDIGAETLFWDKKGRGLLGDVDDAVSWEEDGGWSHNWLPAKSHLPTSSYSFDNLLSTKWPSIEIIPDQRCVHTATGAQRLYKLISDGQHSTPSLIRDGVLDTIWKALLEWTKRSYADYALHPIKLTGRASKRIEKDEPISTLIRSIPTLFNLPTTPAPPISSSDINSLFPSRMSIIDLMTELFISIWNLYMNAMPIAFLSRFTILSSRQPEFSRLKVKINLALCALSWDIVIGIWRLKRDNARLYRALEEDGAELIPDIMLGKSRKSNESQDVSTPDRSRRKRRSPKVDDIAKLERRRGASPSPLRSLKGNRSGSGSSGSSSPSIRRSSSSAPPRKRKAHPIQPSKNLRTIYGLDQHTQTSPQRDSGSDWFDVSPRRRPSLGEDHEKIKRWYSRSPRRSSESDSSTSSGESDHLPTPLCVRSPLSLPSRDSPSPEPRTPEKVNDPVDDHILPHIEREKFLKPAFQIECQEDTTSSFVADLLEFLTSPIIALGLLIGLAMLLIWWDPPKSAGVVE